MTQVRLRIGSGSSRSGFLVHGKDAMRRTRSNRLLVAILALSLTTVGSATLLRSASAVTVTHPGSAWHSGSGSSYGDPDGTNGGVSGSGGGFVPHTSLKSTDYRTVGGGASSKMGWWDTVRILWAEWRGFLVR
jgi:hypothetical protein